MGRARAWHLLTFLVAAFAVMFQLVLIVRGHYALVQPETTGVQARGLVDQPDLGTRVVRFFSYFTILSNLLVAATTLTLAAAADRNTKLWRVLRLNAVVGITVTGIVHWFFLRPLLDLHGADYAADKLLHIVVPILALVGWLAFGPRGRVLKEDLAWSAIFPGVYMVWTLVHGEVSEWYPYPFTDVNAHGYAVVLVNAVAVMALLVVVSSGALWADKRLAGYDGSIR
jgi:hypothetical protein